MGNFAAPIRCVSSFNTTTSLAQVGIICQVVCLGVLIVEIDTRRSSFSGARAEMPQFEAYSLLGPFPSVKQTRVESSYHLNYN